STSGPMLIIAGPGTGKTYTLIQRAVFLIQKKHVKPENIMLATFTDKAAQELTTRISEALSSRNILADTGSMYTGTFHALCSRILRDYADFTGLGKTFRILDDFGHAYLIMQNFKRFEAIPGISQVFKNPGKWKRSCELRDYINSVSEELIDPEELTADTDPAVSALGQAMTLHDEILRDNDAMSYSALLAQTYRFLRSNPEILESLQRKIQYIMIDEYQDTNYVQEQLVFLLGNESKNICVVGDDDQSLYRFRGATVRNILEFPEKFGKNECKVIRLMLNYRSTPEIVDFASKWMNDTGEFFSWENFRHPKKLEAHKPAAAYPSVMRLADVNDVQGWHEKILTFLKSLKDSEAITDYSQAAFLFRSVKSQNVQELAQYLDAHGISVYSPRSNLFFSRSEIRFAIGCMISIFPEYLKSLESGAFSDSESIKYYRGCLQNLNRYIDKPAYSGLKRYLLMKREYHAKFRGYTNYTYSDLLYEIFAFEPFTHALNAQISGKAKDLRMSRNLSKLVQVFRDYERSYNVNNIHSKYMASQFMMMMNIYIRFRMDEGLDEYESDSEIVPAGHVAFMTIHQAKGREFPVVFVDSLESVPSAPGYNQGNAVMTQVSQNYYKR
ncbi:MAG: ATP-dependent helicase, partial [Synergistaceae bacterium]|nr:ATP-dependent helicase [Synergistaceae bacterium]